MTEPVSPADTIRRLTEALERIALGFGGDEFEDSADACERHT